MTSSKNTSLFTLSVVATASICSCFTYLARNYTCDDALIYYRYIQNCIDGNGLVYNIGEKFNGLTSPLYTYLSIGVAFLVRTDIQYTQIALGGIFFFLSCLMLVPLLRNTCSEKLLMLFPPLLATSTYFYKTFGLETPMLLFLLLAAIVLYQRGKYQLLTVTGALLLLTRGESLFLILAIITFHFLAGRKTPSLKVFIVPFFILALHFLFNYCYYGALFPGTLSAKIQQGGSGLWGRFAFMHHSPAFPAMFFNNNLYVPLLLAALVAFGLYSFRKNTTARLLFVFLCMYCLFYVVLNIPDYFWYYGPAVLVLYIFACLGLQAVTCLVPRVGYQVAIALFCVLFCLQSTISYKLLAGNQGQTHYRVIGEWIRDNTPADASVACIEIGHIGWYSGRYIIDILGLVNPYNADFIGQRDFNAWLKHYSPDYILGWVPLRPHEISIRELVARGEYTSHHMFDFNGWQFELFKKSNQTKDPVSTQQTSKHSLLQNLP